MRRRGYKQKGVIKMNNESLLSKLPRFNENIHKTPTFKGKPLNISEEEFKKAIKGTDKKITQNL